MEAKKKEMLKGNFSLKGSLFHWKAIRFIDGLAIGHKVRLHHSEDGLTKDSVFSFLKDNLNY